MKRKIYYYNVDIIRVILAIGIICFHIFYSYIIPYINENETYMILKDNIANAGYIVECFLIISGFFMFQITYKQATSAFGLFVERIVKLWPVFAFYNLLTILLFNEKVENCIINLFFLRATGLSTQYNTIIWYIGPFFWGSIFIYSILKAFKRNQVVPIFLLLSYCGYAININYTNEAMGRETIYYFISLAMCRIIAGLSAGILLGMLYDRINYYINRLKTFLGGEKEYIIRVAFTIIELLTLLIFIIYMFTDFIKIKNPMFIIIEFSILLLLLTLKVGKISLILDNRFFGKLGKYTYSIYVMQEVGLKILEKTLYQQESFLMTHPFLTVEISVLIIIIFGVMTYYLIEKPCVLIYKKGKNKIMH